MYNICTSSFPCPYHSWCSLIGKGQEVCCINSSKFSILTWRAQSNQASVGIRISCICNYLWDKKEKTFSYKFLNVTHQIEHPPSYLFSHWPEIRKEVAMFYKLCDQAKWLLNGHASNHVDHVRIAPLGHLLHSLNLMNEIFPLVATGWYYRATNETFKISTLRWHSYNVLCVYSTHLSTAWWPLLSKVGFWKLVVI